MSKKISQDTKDIILTNLWSSLTIFLFGILAAYLLRKNAEEDKNAIFWFTVILFFIIAVILFIIKALKQKKRYEKRRQNLSKDITEINKDGE